MKTEAQLVLLPETNDAIGRLEEKCRRMVTRRAALSAGAAAVPIPGIDIAADLKLFKNLIEDINTEFGLTPAQIGRLQPQLKALAYRAVAGVGGMLVGKLVTRKLIVVLLKRTAGKQIAKQATKFVPLAGQVVSAAIGFAAFRIIGNQHVDACVTVARQVVKEKAAM
ncbi:MAG TPA: hypothetical protein VIT92_12000 [Burkholderiaceae bacterium]